MRYMLTAALLPMLCGAAEEPVGSAPAAEQAAAEPVSRRMTPEERRAAAVSIKRVMLRRCVRMCAERHRYTRENAAESAALARELHAPEALVHLLQLEAGGTLSGRKQYDCRQLLEKVQQAYGVDALGIRLFVEGLRYPQEELYRVVEALPLETVFNLLPAGAPEQEELLRQCATLADTYAQMVEVYSGVNSREQADAAAARLIPLLHAHDETLPLRMRILNVSPDMLPAKYADLLQPKSELLKEQRRRLRETAYYGSPLLAALDYLLS